MTGTTVYGIPGSPFLRSVEIVLKEKDVPYHFHALKPGEHKQPDYIARHPFGRVPAFEHDGFAIYETQAILRYLDEVFPSPPLTPGSAKERARMNQTELATACLCSRSHVSDIELGHILPTLEEVRHMEKALDADGVLLELM